MLKMSITKIIFITLILFKVAVAQSDDDTFTYRKILPYGLETEVIDVLKSFPELKSTYISFKYKKIPDAIMQSQPTLWSLIFKKKENRRYHVYINLIPSIEAPLESFPQNVIKGIIAHELAHICYYQQNSNLRLISDFLRYPVNCPFKKQFERNTDIIVIQHGLGKYLKEAWQYTGFDANIPDVMKDKKKFYYLSPLEIDELMKKNIKNP